MQEWFGEVLDEHGLLHCIWNVWGLEALLHRWGHCMHMEICTVGHTDESQSRGDDSTEYHNL